jgi:hypothetical protein
MDEPFRPIMLAKRNSLSSRKASKMSVCLCVKLKFLNNLIRMAELAIRINEFKIDLMFRKRLEEVILASADNVTVKRMNVSNRHC